LKIKVLKFGGTSVTTAEARACAAQRVFDARQAGFEPIAVVSAIGRKGAPYATDTLIGEYRGVNPQIEPLPRELDLIMVCGEIISAVVFAQTCRSLGLQATAMTGMQAGIQTDGQYGNARITRVEAEPILKLLELGITPVICGFQGASEANPNEITTLGRGGTDTTAAAIGAAVQACAVEIYTDVDGIKTADPNAVPNAATLRRVSYEEVAELAHLGAKVLHPRSAEIAMRHAIPLWVKNSFTGNEGTEIVNEDVSYEHGLTGITHSGKLVYLQFDLSEIAQVKRSEVEQRLFGVLAQFDIGLYMLNLSPAGLGFGVEQSQFASAERLLDGLLLPSDGESCILQLGPQSQKVRAQQGLLGGKPRQIRGEITEGCTMISVVGRGYFGKAGVFYSILNILNEDKVQVFQTADSDFSVSFLIPETETHRAVRALHDRLVSPNTQ
jgi:aspartate kinase